MKLEYYILYYYYLAGEKKTFYKNGNILIKSIAEAFFLSQMYKFIWCKFVLYFKFLFQPY